MVVQNQRSDVYINCTTLKLVVDITNTVCSVLVQAEGLYTYRRICTDCLN